MRRPVFEKLCLLLAWLSIAAGADAPFSGFDAFAEKSLKDWKVAGFSIAVVKDGNVIFEKGYGLRDVERNLRVTPWTLFAIGSATKSFTVSSLGVLVDQGKLDWDKPVRDFMPDFRLQDQFATERMTPRDLVTHRSGLPRHDLMWYNASLSRLELFSRLRYLEPNKDFRTNFQYQNLMFMTAGLLAERVSGMKWEDGVRQAIFEPLGMSGSNFSVDASQKSSDFSKPYTLLKEEIRETPFRNIDTIGPAGSINSNVEDMSKYIRMHLAQGKGVLKEKTELQMMTPQMVANPSLSYRELGDQSYGMGFFINYYRGHKFVHHGGNIDGFSALVGFLPQENLGLVVLSNQNASKLPAVVAYRVWDLLLGLEPIDWTTQLKAEHEKTRLEAESSKKKIKPHPNTHPSHDLAAYCGKYEHPAYGVAAVKFENGQLTFLFNRMPGPLKHFHYDVFEIVPGDDVGAGHFRDMKVAFHSSLKGDVDSLQIGLEPNAHDIVFTRKDDQR